MAEPLLLRTRPDSAPFFNKPMDRSFSLRMPILCKYGYVPQMIVSELITQGPSPWHVLATQSSAAQTPGFT